MDRFTESLDCHEECLILRCASTCFTMSLWYSFDIYFNSPSIEAPSSRSWAHDECVRHCCTHLRSSAPKDSCTVFPFVLHLIWLPSRRLPPKFWLPGVWDWAVTVEASRRIGRIHNVARAEIHERRACFDDQPKGTQRGTSATHHTCGTFPSLSLFFFSFIHYLRAWL